MNRIKQWLAELRQLFHSHSWTKEVHLSGCIVWPFRDPIMKICRCGKVRIFENLLLLFLLLGFFVNVHAQEPLVSQTINFNSVSAGAGVGLAGISANQHIIQWWAFGTVSTCTVELDSSPDNTTWSTLISGQTCTSNGASSITASNANYVRLNVTALSGGGTVLVIYKGYNTNYSTPTQPVSGTVTANAGTGQFNVTCTAANCPVNMAQENGVAPSMGNGTTDTGTRRVTLSSDSTGQVSPAANATATAAAECNILSAASTNSTSCKGSAGNIYGYEIYNTTTTIYYLRLYNTSSAPTCSSATGFIRSIPIVPAAAAGGSGGQISNQVIPVNFGTGIGYCITGGSSSTDNTNAAVGIFGEIRYK